MTARKRRSFPINENSFSLRGVQEQVLLDMVHKYPRGPKGTLVKDDYRSYSTDPDIRNTAELGYGWACGYSPLFLYRIAMAMREIGGGGRQRPTGEYDYREVVRSLWPDCGERGITRRSRRLAHRIGRAVSHIMNEGVPGIWKVTWGYNALSTVTVAANNDQDALNQAKIFFGPFIDKADSWRMSATFIREGSQLELLNVNKPMLEAIDDKNARIEKEIEKLRNEIEENNCLKGLVEVYSITCMEA